MLLRPLPVLLERWSDDAEHLRIDRRLNRTESQGYLKPRRFWFPDQPVLDRAWLSGRVPADSRRDRCWSKVPNGGR